jgi:hypothetical protein
MDVVGAGFGRTGTLSVKVALETLGFGPCYHMSEVFAHPEHAPLWQAAAEGAPPDWERLFSGYRSTVDWPGCTFYEALVRAHPEARVLLTVRDPERWYESVAATIYAAGRRVAGGPTPEGPPAGGPPAGMVAFGRMVDALVWKRTFDGRFEDRDHAIAVFERHNREVQERVPADRLLVFDVAQGWEPLCRFLGVDVPAGQDFPHLNDRGAFVEGVQRRAPGGPPGPR